MTLLQMDSGDSRTTLGMYLMPLNRTPINETVSKKKEKKNNDSEINDSFYSFYFLSTFTIKICIACFS